MESELVAVEQADRDAAAEQYAEIQSLVKKPLSKNWLERTVVGIKGGRWDKDAASVQAFARHRLASITALRAELAGVRSLLTAAKVYVPISRKLRANIDDLLARTLALQPPEEV